MEASGATRLAELEAQGDHDALVDQLQTRIAADRRALADPWVKDWCARRWRALFVAEAARDPKAVSAASARVVIPGTDISVRRGPDQRPERQRIAERFLRNPAPSDFDESTPPARHGTVSRTTLIFCPGLVGSMLPERAFRTPFAKLAEQRGWRFICAEAHPMRGCEANVADLEAAIERGEGLDEHCQPISPQDAEPPGDVFLLGYSKGAPDALTLLVRRPDLAKRIKAVFCWAGAIGGSFLADDIYGSLARLNVRPGHLAEPLKTILRTVFPVINLEAAASRLDDFDVMGGIGDVTTGVREAFLAENSSAIDALGVPIFSISGATTPLEVPYFQVQGAMELSRYDADNDMQVTQDQARLEIPMASHLAVLHAHHWDMSYDPFPVAARMGSANLDHPFPRQAALTAIFELSAELGLIE